MVRENPNWAKKTIRFLKNNYSWLPIIPIIIGGLYQVFCISSIGYQYLRFFSLTQFLIDGVILICLFSILIISFIIYVYIIHPISIYGKVTYLESYEDELKRKKNERFHFITIMILLIPLTTYFGYHSYRNIIEFNFTYQVFIFLYSLAILFFIVLNGIYNLQDVKFWPGIGYNEESKLKKFLHTCLHLFFYFQVFLLSYAIVPIAKSLKSFSLSDLSNTHNFSKYLDCNKKLFEDFQTAQIIYYNDKYIFSEIITKKETVIKIDSFESFINKTCNIN